MRPLEFRDFLIDVLKNTPAVQKVAAGSYLSR